jgi:hypothetical protein
MKILAILLITTLNVGAQLKWDRTEAELSVHPAQVAGTAIFHCVNTGDQAVELKSVKAGCSCLAPRFDKQTLAPGESGRVELTMDLRKRSGEQRKKATVITGNGSKTDLFVTTTIPELYQPESRRIVWEADCEDESKTVRLINPLETPVNLIVATSTINKLAAELITVREGYEYDLVLKRISPEREFTSIIIIYTEPPPGHAESKRVIFYARVN